MLNRRTFAALLAGSVAAPRTTWSEPVQGKTVFYASTGGELALYDIDFADAALHKRTTYTLPANIQYAWLHPSKQYFYVVSSAGGPGVASDKNFANAFRVDRATGALTPHGDVQPLPSRPIHASVDRAGEYLLTAFNAPSHVTVHRIQADGTLGNPIQQPRDLRRGIYAHQILATPSNQTAILVTRGNNATPTKPEDPGALEVYSFKNGMLGNKASVKEGTGLGFGPRHLDFHPTRPWVYVSMERQNKIYTYVLGADGGLAPQPAFMKDTLVDMAGAKPMQQVGPIHVHPNGRFVYITNRCQGEVEVRRQEGVQRRLERHRGFLDRSADRRADSHPDHRRPRHPSAQFRHRSGRAAPDRNQHPADAARRWLNADRGPHGLSHRR